MFRENYLEGRRTYEFDTPAKDCSLEVFILSQGTILDDLDGVNNRHSAIEFSAGNIVI